MHALNGQAKAMVVTERRQTALDWSEEMDAYIAKKGYGKEMRTLVAFSGTLNDRAGESVSEIGVNGVSDTAAAFKDDSIYKVSIVANKFQTGFDEPRLMAMYVDKKLSGIATVQTLSSFKLPPRGGVSLRSVFSPVNPLYPTLGGFHR